MKRLANDDEALIPAIIAVGVGVLALFGIGSAVGMWGDFWAFLRDAFIAILLFIFGVMSLMGKFTIPRTWAVWLGLVAIGLAVWFLFGGVM